MSTRGSVWAFPGQVWYPAGRVPLGIVRERPSGRRRRRLTSGGGDATGAGDIDGATGGALGGDAAGVARPGRPSYCRRQLLANAAIAASRAKARLQRG
jgi:hypothetical protein